MRILQVAELLHPRHGGIAEGVYQQGIEFLAQGHQMEAVAADAEPVDRLSQSGVSFHSFPPTIGAWKYSPDLAPWFKENIPRFDVVVLNGLWMAPMRLAAQAALKAKIPYVVMPHGMMDPYFQRTRKQALIKKLYWTFSEKHTVAGARSLFFTAQDEESKARAAYPLQGVAGVQVGYGIRDPQRPSSPPPTRHGVKLCFMSRIHPKKGLDVLIAALQNVHPDVSVDIWGTGDDGYTREIQIEAQPLGDRVRWRGFVSGEDKWKALEDCDAMILPSRQENFGVIVAEAMSVSRPVLISHEVNIWKEVEGDGGGLAAPCTSPGIAEMIEKFRTLSLEERGRMGAAGRSSFLSRFTIQASSAKFLRALEEAAR